jgi:hypothetical protein
VKSHSRLIPHDEKQQEQRYYIKRSFIEISVSCIPVVAYGQNEIEKRWRGFFLTSPASSQSYYVDPRRWGKTEEGPTMTQLQFLSQRNDSVLGRFKGFSGKATKRQKEYLSHLVTGEETV